MTPTKSWRFTEGGTNSRSTARGGAGGGLGYSFRSQPHACFCGCYPCIHGEFTGTSTPHRVVPCVQEKADRELTTSFIDSIVKGTPLASAGDLKDSTAGSEPVWLSLSKGKVEVSKEAFAAAGGAGPSGVRTIAINWKYVDIQWLVKVRSNVIERSLPYSGASMLTNHSFDPRVIGQD